jgi:hypothetical protein
VWNDGRTVDEVTERRHSVRAFDVSAEYLTPELLAASTEFGKGVLRSADRHVNTLMEPRLIDVYLKSWVVD